MPTYRTSWTSAVLHTVAYGVSYVASATQSGTIQTTFTGNLGPYTTGFAASVVSANTCGTVILALECTDADNAYCSSTSNVTVCEFSFSAQSLILSTSRHTITHEPSQFVSVYTTSFPEGTISISEVCFPTTYGAWHFSSCNVTGFISAQGRSLATATNEILTQPAESTETMTIDGTHVAEYPEVTTYVAAQIPITAGAANLPSTVVPCSSRAAAATGISKDHKVLIPIGLAVVGALV